MAVLCALVFSALDALAKARVAELPAVQLVWARYAGQTAVVFTLLLPWLRAGVALVLAGALILIRPGPGVFSWAALLPVGAAVCYAAYAITTRKVGPDEPVLTALFHTGLLGTAITSVLMVWGWQPVAGWHWLGLAGLGVLGAGGQFCMIKAYSLAEASVIAPFGYIGLLFATLWGYGLFGEVPDLWTGDGALVILGAGLYVWHRETQAAKGG